MNRKPQFIENFQDSEVAQSQLNQSADHYPNRDDGQPIQLVRIRPSGKVELIPEALDIICSCDLPVGFVCLAGKYRTGKSFLLNKLLYLDNKGFRVDESTNACTQGIWMWSQPFKNQRYNNHIFFLDTEGSQSLTKDANNDTTIFVLAVLLSSYFMYNSQGTIDEKSISELNLVTRLSRNILAQQNINNSNNEEIIYRYMPKFMWILRDFTLELRGADGRRMSSLQYLEDCLLQQNTLIRVNQESRKTRRAITSYFKERDCLTLVRPAREEIDLQRLDGLPEHALRRQFVEGVNDLRQKIMRDAGPKMFDNTPLYGSSIVSMLQSYVESINNGGIPTIKTAWEHISEDEGAYAYNRALEVYNQLYEESFMDDQPKGQQIHKILMSLREDTMTEFQKNLTQPNDAYQSKLKQFLNEKEDAILDVNKQLNDQRNIDILRECSSEFMRKIEANHYDGKAQQLQRDYDNVLAEYKAKAKGENKSEILTQFSSSMMPIIMELMKPKQDLEAKLRQKEDERKMAEMQRQLERMKRKAELAEENAKKQIAMSGKQPASNRPRAPGKPEKKTGCCGGGDCIIM